MFYLQLLLNINVPLSIVSHMDSKLFHATWLQCLHKLKAFYISGQKQILSHCIMEKLVIYQLTVLLICLLPADCVPASQETHGAETKHL